MSLAPAKKSIEPRPAKMGVTDPTDKVALEKDVDRKMRFYGVIEAFRRGRMPDNAQIDETLRYLIQHSPVDIEKLSPEGKKLVTDCRGLIETTRLMVQEKNADEVLQQFVYHTSSEQFRDRAIKGGQAGIPDSSNLPNKDDAKRDTEQGVQHLRTLAQLLLTNSEARKLVSDFALIGRDLFAQGASRAAERARPAPERMAKVDDAAASSPIAASSSQGEGLPEVAPGVDIQKDGFRGALKSAYQSTKTKAEERTDEKTTAHSTTAPAATAAATEAAVPPIQTTTTGYSATAPPQAAPDHPVGVPAPQVYPEAGTSVSAAPVSPTSDGESKKKGSIFAKGSQRIPEKHKERARVERERAKQFFDEEFPQERRDQFVWRMKKVVTECQSHTGYQEAISWLLSTVEAYFTQAKTVGTNQTKKSTGVFANDPVINQAWLELRTLLERFAGGRSMDGIFNVVKKLQEDAKGDKELRAWWRRATDFVRKTLIEPGFILSPQFTSQSRVIFQDQAREFFDDRYKGHRELLAHEGQTWVDGWKEDELNRRLFDGWSVLIKDLFMGENGKFAWKGALWSDVRRVIVPQLVEQVGYVPIPRIEYTDDELDLVIENLTLQGKNLFPNLVEIDARTHMRITPYDALKDESRHTVTFTISQIQADMRDVAFYFRKKTGFPKIKDSGLADVLLGGNGISARVTIVNTASEGKNRKKGQAKSLFKVKDVHVKVDTLKFSIRDSRHDLLYKTLKPLATGLIKKQISKAIEEGIRTGFEWTDGQLVQVKARIDETEGHRMDAIKQVFTKTSTASEGSSGAASSERAPSPVRSATSKSDKRHSKFKIVPKRDSMLLPDVGHERGWMKKADDRADAAADGEGWKSRAFNIVPGKV